MDNVAVLHQTKSVKGRWPFCINYDIYLKTITVIAFGILEPITKHRQLKQQTYKLAFLFCKQNVAHLISTVCETQILNEQKPGCSNKHGILAERSNTCIVCLQGVYHIPLNSLPLYLICKGKIKAIASF